MNNVGTCTVLYCLDLAYGIDLGAAQERLTTWRQATLHHKSRFRAGDAVLPPVRVRSETEAVPIGGWSTTPGVELALYEEGALCVTWSIPFDCPLEELVELSVQLYDNEELTARSRQLAEELALKLGPAADRPHVHALIEDYVIFEVAELQCQVEDLARAEGGVLARVLRAEPDELSPQEVEDALSNRVAYRASEVCYIDWLGTFLVGEANEDERLVLELATVELLELRLLDAQLDIEIENAYALIGRPRRRFVGRTGQHHELERVARMQADGAVLHGRIDNALKLLGDDYLARVYRTAAERFHFNDQDASIERKLAFLRNVYENLANSAAHRRSEVLEWIIILLIAIDIILYFTPLR